MAGRAKPAVALAVAVTAALFAAWPALAGPAPPNDPVVCSPASGVVRIQSAGKYSHLVDRVVVGYRASDNTIHVDYGGASKDEGPYEVHEDCPNPGGTWKLITASLDAGADNLRLDAQMMPADFKPVPASIEARASGGGTRDELLGHAGPDVFRGGSSFDELKSFGGDDVLVGGERSDRMVAGSGDDKVRAGDGANKADRIVCGPGDDVAIIDPPDRARGCEKIKLR